MIRWRVLPAVLVLAAIMILPLGAGISAGEPTQTIKGELVDLRCYLTADKHGADHSGCATMCAKDNLPVGILTSDGKLYTLIVQPAALAGSMALQAQVTGAVRGEMIVPDSVQVMKDGKWVELKLPEQMM